MKKLKGRFLLVITVLLFSSGLFFFSSCGLETYYYLDPPKVIHEAIWSSEDFTTCYFSFLTTEGGENNTDQGTFRFSGTGIYYMIYNSYSDMINREELVATLNTGKNYTAAAEQIITKYAYQKLNFSSGSFDPAIESTGTSRYIYIRLNDYEDDENYKAAFCIGDKELLSYDDDDAVKIDGLPVIPKRAGESTVKHGFTFNKKHTEHDSENPVPKEGDPDVYFSSTASEEGVWYVDMYAISIGQDESFTPSYSQVAFLGSVEIEEIEK